MLCIAEINDLLSTLITRKYDQQSLRSLELQQEDVLGALQHLKAEVTQALVDLDHRIQTEGMLDESTQSLLLMLQRMKGQLIALRPTMTNEANDALRVSSAASTSDCSSVIVENRSRLHGESAFVRTIAEPSEKDTGVLVRGSGDDDHGSLRPGQRHQNISQR